MVNSIFDSDQYRKADYYNSNKIGIGKLASKLMLENKDMGFGRSVLEATTTKIGNTLTKLKRSVDPLNLAYKMTGGSKLLTTGIGRMLGRSSKDINYFTGTIKDPKYKQILSGSKVPGNVDYVEGEPEKGSKGSPSSAYHNRTSLRASAPGISRSDSDRDILVKSYKILYDIRKHFIENDESNLIKENEELAQKDLKSPKTAVQETIKDEQEKQKEGFNLFGLLSVLPLIGGIFTNIFDPIKSAIISLPTTLLEGISKIFTSNFTGTLSKITDMLSLMYEEIKTMVSWERIIAGEEGLSGIFGSFKKIFKSLDPFFIEVIPKLVAQIADLTPILVRLAGVLGLATAAFSGGFSKPGSMTPPGVTPGELGKDSTSQKIDELNKEQYKPPKNPTITEKSSVDDKRQKAMEFFVGKGYSKEQAAGLVGNIEQESRFKTAALNPNDNGSPSKGLIQWHKERIDKFKQVVGKPIEEASFEEQLEFINWELNNTEKPAAKKLKGATTVEEAAHVVEKDFGRSQATNPKRGSGTKPHFEEERVKFAQKAFEKYVEPTPADKTSEKIPIYIDGDPKKGISGYMPKFAEPAPVEPTTQNSENVQPAPQPQTAVPAKEEQQTPQVAPQIQPPKEENTAINISNIPSRVSSILSKLLDQNEMLNDQQKAKPVVVTNVQTQPQPQSQQQNKQPTNMSIGVSVRNDDPIFEKMSMQNWRNAIG